jgi:trans-aconitate methyltransferase
MADLHDKDVAAEFYEQRYEEGYMEDWDDLKKAKVIEVLSSIQLPATGKALDFGCGNGVFTRILKDNLPQWEVYGVEISRTAVQNAARKFPDCHFFAADESASHAGQFDFIFSHHVIEHVQDLGETFATINAYLKPHSWQLHILPCGNPGSYEYNIVALKKDGIEKDKENRFFFEEPGHLRRLSTNEFVAYEKQIGFQLRKDFYSNQEAGAIDWITKSSPRFVKKLTDPVNTNDEMAAKKMQALRRKLLPLTYFQFPYSKYVEIKSKWRKGFMDHVKLAVLFIPAMIAKPLSKSWQQKAATEWNLHKTEKNGSEMFLFFER